MSFLPTSKKELDALGWEQPDIILFTGDAYIDHPSFGAAVIGRTLQHHGYRVAIVPQPNWRDDLRDFKKLGPPKLFFGVTSGSMDSMVNHYTANRRLRSDDAYTPDARAGQRPDYAATVYTKILKQLYPSTPVILGGIEASLRRFTHYDYWSDTLKPTILHESGADLLVYGMGEKPILQIARKIAGKLPLENIPQTARLIPLSQIKNHIPGSAGFQPADAKRNVKASPDDARDGAAAPFQNQNSKIQNPPILLHSHERCLADKLAFAENFRRIEEESNRLHPALLIEPVGDRATLVTPPHPPLTPAETDASFDLPYTRLPHPRYKNKRIPAYDMIRHSITLHRGCFGGCSFCTISAHQGKFISSRTEKSILAEVDRVTRMPDFAGHITDLGGPSANMWQLRGKNESICASCRRPSCLHPKPCRNLSTDHAPLTALCRQAAAHPKVKKITIGSGIRYDLLIGDNGEYLDESTRDYFCQLVRHHVSGRLKVAPEHSEAHILDHIRKPRFELFLQLKKLFDELNTAENLRQQLIPYFISSLPTCTEADMRRLADKLQRLRHRPEQTQDFTPTPLTLDTAIYYSGIDPYTRQKVYIPKTLDKKLRQRAYLQKSPAAKTHKKNPRRRP